VANSAELKDRWKTLQLLGPVFELLKRGAPRADFDHHSYDLAQLALRLIDYIVHNQASLEGSVSLDSVTDHLTQVARRMNPADPARPYIKVARLVFSAIFNDGRPHEVTWLDADTPGEDPHSEVFRFRLLRMVDSESGAAITATDEAILLYLQALNTDLADRALALKLLVEIQMQAGEFDKALDSARQATRTARGLSASLRERLADTQRDVSTVDWHGEMPHWLTAVRNQIRQQIDRDRQLLDLANLSGDDPSAAEACREIAEEVRAGGDVWTRLERYVLSAIPVFLEAQNTQRFRPQGLAAAIDMSRDVFQPAITAPDPTFHNGVQALITGVAAPPTPVCWALGDLTDLLFKAPTTYDRRPPEVDDPGELGEPPGESIPDDIARCAADVLSIANQQPTRVSQLLADARRRASEVDDPNRLCDVLWGAALWVFVAGEERAHDDHPGSADLAAAVAALTAVADEQTLDDDRYQGPDLTLARPVALDALDLEAVRAS
jgi:tetratricopeptide (TPR) repeat protein